MEKRDVFVTEEDIKNGLRSTPNSCPIALAMSRVFPEYEVAVNKNTILLNSIKREMYYSRGTTNAQWNFVRKFDKGKPVEPFQFKFVDPESLPGKTHNDFPERLNKTREKVFNR